MVARRVFDPPAGFTDEGLKRAGWWHAQDGRVVCDLCPRARALKDGDFGFCFVRQNAGGEMVLNTYGSSTGFCIDPVEFGGAWIFAAIRVVLACQAAESAIDRLPVRVSANAQDVVVVAFCSDGRAPRAGGAFGPEAFAPL